jgi:hypothetical protein
MMDWNVCDPFSNTDLIRRLTVKSQGCAAKLLVIANFSGFLQVAGKWKEANKQIEELFRHSREENSVALWIEPKMNAVTEEKGGFMARLIDWFKKAFSALISVEGDEEKQEEYQESSVYVKHPLQEDTFLTQLVVKQFELPLRRKS